MNIRIPELLLHPLPDRAHDDLRIAVLEVITQLDAARIRIDALHVRADTALDNLDVAQRQIAALEKKVNNEHGPSNATA